MEIFATVGERLTSRKIKYKTISEQLASKTHFWTKCFCHNFPQVRPHIDYHKSDDRKERMIFSNAAYSKQVFSASHPHFR